MSLHLPAVHQVPRVHRTGGSVVTFRGARLDLALENYSWHCNSRLHELGRSEHHRRLHGFVYPLDSGASKALVWSSQLEDSGSCPPLGNHCRLGHSLQMRPS
jgi:hypothetical protein